MMNRLFDLGFFFMAASLGRKLVMGDTPLFVSALVLTALLGWGGALLFDSRRPSVDGWWLR